MSKFHAYHKLDEEGSFAGTDFYTKFRTNVGDELYVVLGKKNKSTRKTDYFLSGKYRVKNVSPNDSTGAHSKKPWRLKIEVLSKPENPILFSNKDGFDAEKYRDEIISTGGFKQKKAATEEFFELFDGIIAGSEVVVDDDSFGLDANQDNNESSPLNKVLRSILERRGQPKFRRDLLKIYNNRCCVTGCAVMELLEAAHINPFSEDGDNSLSNGLILRADIHTLFDRNLLTVDENCVVRISKDLIGSEYEYLRGKKIQRNSAALPSEFSLKKRYESFMERENSLH